MMDRLPFEKPRVFRDAKALALFRQSHRRCAVKGCRYLSEVHHIKSRSLGGGDEESNLLPLCNLHHSGASGPHQQGHIRWLRNFEAQLSDDDAAKVRTALGLAEDI